MAADAKAEKLRGLFYCEGIMKRPKEAREYSKHEGLKIIEISKRICIGERAGIECNREFQPRSRWNYLCDKCNSYIANLGGD